MTCKYTFKKGKKKGEQCKNTCQQGVYCITHMEADTVVIKQPSYFDNLKSKILTLDTCVENKEIILKHFYNMKRLDPYSTEYYKNQLFVDNSVAFPWNKYFDIHKLLRENEMTVKHFLQTLQDSLDKEIFGMANVKKEIINIVCKFITNPKSCRNCVALHGAAGVGKSKFVKVLSNVLGIPMNVVSLGGIKDSAFFLGHGYVYVESGPGKIIQNIIDSAISNPIIYFDELDKVSETDNGKDIYSFLSYLTDNTQNSQYTDHYFYGMKFDLSKVFYFFTFNDIHKIDRILLDRLNVVYVNTPSEFETCSILQNHCIPEIVQNIGIKKSVCITTSQITSIIQRFRPTIDFSVSSGIRDYYRIIEKILLELNKHILLGSYNFDIITFTDDQFTSFLEQVKVDMQCADKNVNLLSMYM